MDLRSRFTAKILGAVLLVSSVINESHANARDIVPGKVKTQVSVLPNGTLDYTVPVQAPVGSGGMTPQVTLKYNGGAGNGLLGRGWSVSGMGAITRCAETTAIDGKPDGVGFDSSDRYCLNGNRLILERGDYGAPTSEYRTHLNSNQRIRIATASADSPLSFEVTSADGRTFFYGTTRDSRIELQGTDIPYIWALSKQRDRSGNYIEFRYHENNETGEFYPESIAYTGNDAAGVEPYNFINFRYGRRHDPFFSCISGSMAQTAVRLQEVEILKNVPGAAEGNESQVFRRYLLSYDDGDDLPPKALPNNSCDTQLGDAATVPSRYQLILDSRFDTDNVNLAKLELLSEGFYLPLKEYSGNTETRLRQLLGITNTVTADELDAKLKAQLAIRTAYFEDLYKSIAKDFDALNPTQRSAYISDLRDQLDHLKSAMMSDASTRLSDLSAKQATLISARNVAQQALRARLREQIKKAQDIILVPGRSKRKTELFNAFLRTLKVKRTSSAEAALACLAEMNDFQENPLAEYIEGRACESENFNEAVQKFLHFSLSDRLHGDLHERAASMADVVTGSVDNHYLHLLVSGQILKAYEDFAQLLFAETQAAWNKDIAQVEQDINQINDEQQIETLVGVGANGDLLSEDQIEISELKFKIELLTSSEPEQFFNQHIADVKASFAALYGRFSQGEKETIARDDTQTRINNAIQSLKITVRASRVSANQNYQALLDQLLDDGKSSVLLSRLGGSGQTVLQESRVVSISECGSDDTCLSPLSFTWTDENIGWEAPNSNAPVPDSLFSYGSVVASSAGLQTAQATANSETDGDSNGQSQRPALSSEQINLGRRLAKAGRLVDVNGDGRLDWVLSYLDENSVQYRGTWLNTDNGWEYDKEWELPVIINDYKGTDYGRFAEVNFDGANRVDWVSSVDLQTGDQVRGTYLNNGAGWEFAPSYAFPSALYTENVEGVTSEGEPFSVTGNDFSWISSSTASAQSVLVQSQSGGSAFQALDRSFPFSTRSSGTEAAGQFLRLSMTDNQVVWAGFERNGSQAIVNFWRQAGDDWLPEPAYQIQDQHADLGEFVDFNGDGLIDWLLAIRQADGSSYQKALINTGAGWQEDVSSVVPPMYDIRGNRVGYLIDLDGDGQPEWVGGVQSTSGVIEISTMALENGAWAETASGKLPFEFALYDSANEYQSLGQFADIAGSEAQDWLDETYVWHESDAPNSDRDSLIVTNGNWATAEQYRLPVLNADWLDRVGDALSRLSGGETLESIVGVDGNLLDDTVQLPGATESNAEIATNSVANVSGQISGDGLGAMQSSQMLDIDGDGRLDWLKSVRFQDGSEQKAVWLRKSTGWEHSSTFVPPYILTDLSKPALAQVLDINSDGLPDFVMSFRDSSGDTNDIWLNDGSKWAKDTSFTLPSTLINVQADGSVKVKAVMADINADGLLDFVTDSAGGNASYLNAFNVWIPSPIISLPTGLTEKIGDRYLAAGSLRDVNGDGLVDWIKASSNATGDTVYLNTSNGWTEATDYKLPTNLLDDRRRPRAMFVDVNADGLNDLALAYQEESGRQLRTTWLNTGNGWRQSARHTLPNTVFFAKHGRGATLVDLNSDGNVDFIQSVKVDDFVSQSFWLGTPEGWVPHHNTVSVPVMMATASGSYAFNHNFILADSDGDHQVDFLPATVEQTDQSTRLGLDSMPGMINALSDSAKRSELAYEKGYKPYTAFSDGARHSYPLISTNGPSVVVAGYQSFASISLEESDDDFLVSDVQYTYGDYAVDLQRQTSAGFKWSKSVDWVSERVGKTEYRQDFPFTGRPSVVEKEVLFGGLISKTMHSHDALIDGRTTKWNTRPDYKSELLADDLVRFLTPYIAKTVVQSYELDGDLLNTVETEITPDIYGQTRVSIQQLKELGVTHTTTTTYEPDAHLQSWQLNRFKSVTTTKTNDKPGTTELSSVTTRSYDPNGKLQTETTAGLTTTYEYDGFGNPVLSTQSGAGLSRSQTNVFDAQGRYVVETRDANGEINKFEYNDVADSPTKITLNDGVWTSYYYDGFGREKREVRSTEVIQPRIIRFCNVVENAQVRSCPENARYLTALLDNESQGSAPETIYYDVLGREIRRVTANADTLVQIDTEYFLNGKLKRRTVPYNPNDDEERLWVQFQYDAYGRTTAVSEPYKGTRSWTYDGRKVTEFDQLNVPTTTINTHFGAPAEVIDAYGDATKYEYDVFGQLIKTTDPKGNETTVEYDAAGNKARVVDPDHGPTRFTYNVFGDVLTKTDSLGNSETYEYDQFGRKERRTDRGFDKDGVAIDPVVTEWTYYSLAEAKQAYKDYVAELTESKASKEYLESINEINFLNPQAASELVKEVTSSDGYKQILSYDYRTRPVKEEVVIPGGESRVLQTTYAGETTLPYTIRYPNNFSVQYDYDDTGHLESVRNAGLNTVDHYSALIERATFLNEEVAKAIWDKATEEKDYLDGDTGPNANYRRRIRSANTERDAAFEFAQQATEKSHEANDARIAVEFLRSELGRITSAQSRGGRDQALTALFHIYDKWWRDPHICSSTPTTIYPIPIEEYSIEVQGDTPDDTETVTRGGQVINFELPTVCTESHISGYRYLKKRHHRTERRLVDQIIGVMTELRTHYRGLEASALELSQQSVASSEEARRLYKKANDYYQSDVLPQVLYVSRLNQAGNEISAMAGNLFAKAARVYQLHEIEKDIVYWQSNESDEVNRITSETYGNGIISEREYDPKNGTLRSIRTIRPHDLDHTTSVDTSGIVVNQTAGGAGDNETPPPGTEPQPEVDSANDDVFYQDERYVYDARGNLRSRFNGALGTVDTFQYDRLSRLTEANYAFLDSGQTVTQTFAYDSIGNITSKSDVGDYEYHPRVRPHAVTKAGNRIYDYDDAGRMIRGDGSTFEYTTFSKPSLITDDNGTSVEYRYGPSRQRYYQKRTKGQEVSENYYFFKGLYEESVSNGVVEKNVSITAAGKNIAVLKDFSNTFATPEQLEQLLSLDNTLAQVEQSARSLATPDAPEDASPTEGINSAFFDQLNRYSIIANTTGEDTVKESEAGECIVKEEPEASPDGEPAPTTDEEEAYALKCLTDTQKAEARTLFAHQLININYFHYDNLDSVKAVTDNIGELVSINYYDAFGLPIIRPAAEGEGGDEEADSGFGGHEAIVGTELVHMNGRIYDPKIARFVSADPFVPAFGDAQALNRYSYVYNNPMRYVDPSGYKPVTAGQHDRNAYVFLALAHFELEITGVSTRHLSLLLGLAKNNRPAFVEAVSSLGATPEAIERATPYIEGALSSIKAARDIRKAKRKAKLLAIVQVVVTIATSGATSGFLSTWYAAPLLNTAAQFAVYGEVDLAQVALNFATAYISPASGDGGLGTHLTNANITGFTHTAITQLSSAVVRGLGSHLAGGEFEHGFAAGLVEFELGGLLDRFFPGLNGKNSTSFSRIVRSGLIEGVVTEIANETRDGEKLDFFDGFQLGALRQAASEAISPFLGGDFRNSCADANNICNFSAWGNVANLLIEDADNYSILSAIAGAVGQLVQHNVVFREFKEATVAALVEQYQLSDEFTQLLNTDEILELFKNSPQIAEERQRLIDRYGSFENIPDDELAQVVANSLPETFLNAILGAVGASDDVSLVLAGIGPVLDGSDISRPAVDINQLASTLHLMQVLAEQHPDSPLGLSAAALLRQWRTAGDIELLSGVNTDHSISFNFETQQAIISDVETGEDLFTLTFSGGRFQSVQITVEAIRDGVELSELPSTLTANIPSSALRTIAEQIQAAQTGAAVATVGIAITAVGFDVATFPSGEAIPITYGARQTVEFWLLNGSGAASTLSMVSKGAPLTKQNSGEFFSLIRGLRPIIDSNKPAGRGTVALFEVDGLKYWGVNSTNWTAAERFIPEVFRRKFNLTGQGQGQAFLHAEAHAVMTASASLGHSKLPKNIVMHVDRDTCNQCTSLGSGLPLLMRDLGIKTIDIVQPGGHVFRVRPNVKVDRNYTGPLGVGE